MKLRIVFYCLLIAAIFATSATISAEKQMPPADAQKMWDYMTQKVPYTKWSFWPGHRGFLEGNSPHGDYVRIFANTPAIKALKKGEKLPENSMIVKENYAEDKETLKSITPMYKVKGYNPKQGNWFWAKYSPQGKVQAAGKVKGCINCHKSRKDEDWIFHKAH